MNTYCPHCRALHRIDPAKVPEGGVMVRCSECPGVFRLTRRAERDRVRSREVPVIAGAMAEAESPRGESRAEQALGPGETDSAVAVAAPPDALEPPTTEAQTLPESTVQRAPEPAPPMPEVRAAFGPQDKNARAQRIARALVSDIVAYHRERRDRALAAGRLRAEFRGEILKSWNEYVEQVGEDLALNTPYFRDALNDILASGQPVF